MADDSTADLDSTASIPQVADNAEVEVEGEPSAPEIPAADGEGEAELNDDGSNAASEPTGELEPSVDAVVAGQMRADSSRPQDNPVNPGTAGTGPAATNVAVTSTVTPSGAQGPAVTRTYTVRYTNNATTNTAANSIKNARIWLPFMVAADHTTTYTVTCTRSDTTGTGNNLTTCPTTDGMPTGPQTIEGEAGVPNNLLWGVVNIGRGSRYIEFTITATTLLAPQADPCSASTVAVTATANYALAGFLPVNVLRSASSSAPIISGQCANGAVVMTNTVKSPVSGVDGSPIRVLSGDSRVFEASWWNTTSAALTLPIGYTYAVPASGDITQAAWTCGASTGSCPDFGSAATLTSDGNPEGQRVFGSDPDDPDTFITLAPGQKLTYEITLTTKVANCGADSHINVQSAATRGRLDTDPATAPMEAELTGLEIGCVEWLVDEPFSGTAVTDSAWRGIGRACLTKATGTATAPVLGGCGTYTTGVPSTGFNPGTTGLPAGFLQLTDDRTNQTGAVLYDRGVATKNGLVLEFTQYQFGGDTNGADGIGFFLANGAFPLTTTGADGGALGYANKSGVAGLPNGYLGVGFDVFGNFAATSSDAAPQCGGNGTRVLNSVTLRGPGNGSTGYCAVGSTVALSSLNSSYTLRAQRSGTTNTSYQNALLASQRKTRVTIYPLATGQVGPRVTVEMDFGAGYVPVLDRQMTAVAPALVKFGFLGSTGGSKDAHLLGSVRVGTVIPLGNLSMTKVVDGSLPVGQQSTFNVGDVVPYQFVLENTGEDTIYKVSVSDPQIATISCPVTQLAKGAQAICTGTYTVQAKDRDSGHFLNTATAVAALSSDGMVNLSSKDQEDIPVNPSATSATRVIVPGGSASFQIVDNGSTAGLVVPDSATKVAIRLVNPSSGLPTDDKTITVSGQGTWTLDSANKVTFQANAGYSGTVTPLKYEARSLTVVDGVAGSAQATLSVSLSVAPLPVCTADQHRASGRYWEFGTNVELDFGVSGTAMPSAASAAGMTSSSLWAGTFTVTDARGDLQFVVNPATGQIINRDGQPMTRGGEGADKDTPISIPIGVGASPATVFPAGQGTGRFVVVTSSATELGRDSVTGSNTGRLTYRIVDMALNGGLGGLSGVESIDMGYQYASPAVTSVPNADGTGYWVINPLRGSYSIRAWAFDDSGTMGSSVASNVAATTELAAGTLGYEDVRFSEDLSVLATISSNNATTGTARTQVRLLSFNAQTGTLGLHSSANWGSASRLGYSLDFSGNGSRVYVSSIPATTGNLYGVQTATTGVAGNRTLGAAANAGGQTQAHGGTVRRGPDGRMYLSYSGGSFVSYLASPNDIPATSGSWPTASLASGTSTNRALSTTLTDCAIASRGFSVAKLDEDGSPLGGADFALFPDDPTNPGHAGATPVSPGIQPVAGHTGRFAVASLPQGTYWLRETTTPPGRVPVSQDIRVNAALDGTISTPAAPVVPGVELVEDDGAYTFRITNEWRPASLAVLVQVVDPVGGVALHPGDFVISAVPPSGSGLTVLENAPGSVQVQSDGDGQNRVAARPGVTYQVSQARITGGSASDWPSRVESFQRYVADGVDCPTPDLSAEPAVQPSMDDVCWTTVSVAQDSAEVTMPLEGGDVIYRFVDTTLAVPELPNAAGWGAGRYVIFGGLVIVAALALASLHLRRQSRSH